LVNEVEELAELDGSMLPEALADRVARRHVQRGEQRSGPAPVTLGRASFRTTGLQR
jgi:hypothetical protein